MEKKKDIATKEEGYVRKDDPVYEIAPAVDIFENEDEILLHADMPGVTRENISLDIDNGTLSIAGLRKLTTRGTAAYEEFPNLRYVRSFSVPQTIDVGRVEADLKNGVLRLHLPKSEAAKPRQIEIKTA